MGIQQRCHKVGMDGLLYSLENLIHHAERKLFLFLGTVYRRVPVTSVERVKMII